MNKEQIFKILISPRVTEKATRLKAYSQYVFKVCNCADKIQIAAAIKALFNVEIKSVRVCNVKGKSRTFGRIKGKRQDWKKAYITLKEGFEIKSE